MLSDHPISSLPMSAAAVVEAVTLPTTLRRKMEDDDLIRRTGGVTQGTIRRTLHDNDVIRRT